jgi:hypothetical protein
VGVEVEVVNLEAVAASFKEEGAPLAELRLKVSVELDAMSCDLLFFITLVDLIRAVNISISSFAASPLHSYTSTGFFAHIIPNRPLSTPWDSARWIRSYPLANLISIETSEATRYASPFDDLRMRLKSRPSFRLSADAPVMIMDL